MQPHVIPSYRHETQKSDSAFSEGVPRVYAMARAPLAQDATGRREDKVASAKLRWPSESGRWCMMVDDLRLADGE